MVKGTEIEDLPALVRYFKKQLSKHGVSIWLGKECTPNLLDELKPDAIILATGGVHSIAQIPGINRSSRAHFFDWLEKKGAVVMAGVKYEEVTDKGLVIMSSDGRRQLIEADTIVTALPFLPNAELTKAMTEKAPEIYIVGDCSEPRFIMDAIGDGYRIAHVI